MKKKVNKIILIFFLVLLILTLLMAGFFVINYVQMYTFTISEINGNTITALDSKAIATTISNSEDTEIKDSNGNDIDASQLKIGDKIYVPNFRNLGYKGKIFLEAIVTEVYNDKIDVEVPDYIYYYFKLDENRVSKLNLGDTIRVINWPDWIQYDVAYSKGGHSSEHLDNVIWMTKLKQNTEELELIDNINKEAIKEAVVVKVNNDSIDVMGLDDNTDLLTVSFAKEGNIGFKEGQEVLIYFSGMVYQEKDGWQINDVGKIEINKDESGITIPKEVLTNFYSSYDNVKLSVDYINKTGMSLTIKDTNELKYDYPNTYTLLKKNVKSIPSQTQENGYSEIRCI